MDRSSNVAQVVRQPEEAPAIARSRLESALAIPTEELPLGRAYFWEKTRGRQIFLTQPVHGAVRHWRWSDAMNEARRMAAYLEAQNWPAESPIVILSKNCAWWVLAELAIWMSGHVTVPIYTSLPVEAALRLMEHCGPVACFIGPVDTAALVSQAIPPGVTCIRFPTAPQCAALEWEQIVAENDPIRTTQMRPADDVATIIYTSGTMGPPRGAMHRFAAFPYFAKAVTQVTGDRRRQRVLSYLPLAHIAERALTETAAIYNGWRIFFCEDASTFLRDLKRARPTVFFSVPRLYLKFQAGILARITQQRLERLLRIPLVGYFVRKRILRQLGLQAVRFAASGSAPISQELLLWFRRLGLPLVEGYGTTETGITHTAPRGRRRPGWVGCQAPGVETKLDDNQEVLVKSPMNMLGYFGDPDATEAVVTADGFIRTGDLGEVDEGWLKLKGRLKEQFKTSKGKYVLPSAIEMMLGSHEAIDSCLVMGSGLASPFAIVVLSAEAQKTASTRQGRGMIERSLKDRLNTVNLKLAPHERLQFMVATNEAWSAANGFLTPTLKLKRTVLEAHYEHLVPAWSAAEAPIVWHNERPDMQ